MPDIKFKNVIKLIFPHLITIGVIELKNKQTLIKWQSCRKDRKILREVET